MARVVRGELGFFWNFVTELLHKPVSDNKLPIKRNKNSGADAISAARFKQGQTGMRVEFHCPKCLKADAGEIDAGTTLLACRHCGWNRPLADGDLQADAPTRCLACGCDDLWRQKDFPPQLGVAIVGLGILLSTLATAWMRPLLAIGILMAFALADLLLFLVMRDALVCYRCHARFRRVSVSEQHSKFNLELNERYRQEAIKMVKS